jgi:hypothetical protein
MSTYIPNARTSLPSVTEAIYESYRIHFLCDFRSSEWEARPVRGSPAHLAGPRGSLPAASGLHPAIRQLQHACAEDEAILFSDSGNAKYVGNVVL